MKATIQIFLRSDYTKKDGSVPISLRVILNRRKKEYSLGQSVPEPKKFWDPVKKRVKRCSWINMAKINEAIDQKERQAYAIVDEMGKLNVPFTVAEFDKRFRNPIQIRNSFYAYAEKEMVKHQNNKSSKETIRSYKSYISKLKRYKPELFFSEITKEFIEGYEAYMINNGNGINTRHKALSWMRTVARRATADGLITGNPFQHIILKRKPGEREALNENELNRLEKILAEGVVNGYLANALRCFLFSVYTGLRYSDVRNLRFSDIQKSTENGKENKWIRIQMQKTREPVEIPLLPQALELIPVKSFEAQKVLRVPTNQVVNRYLKELSALVGINKRVSFHVARHTFATISITLGIQLHVVSALLGHTDIKTTQIYAKVDRQVKVKSIELWKQKPKTQIWVF